MSRDADLVQEALGAEYGHQLGPEHLQPHLAVVFHVARQVHNGHATFSELAFDAVALG